MLKINNSAQINVLMIILDYHPRTGGAQQQLKWLVPLMLRQNINVTILTRHFGNLPTYEEIDGATVYRLPYKGAKALASIQFMIAALFKINKIKPDIIHAYSFLSPLRTAAIASWLWDIPVVVKVLRGGEKGDAVRLENSPFARWSIRFYRKYVEKYIVISNEITNELYSLEIPRQKQVFIPNGVNTNRFNPASIAQRNKTRVSLNVPLDSFVGVYTGRLVSEKCVNHLIYSWNKLSKTYPNAQLYILGDGELRQELEALSESNIHFNGRVDDVVPYLQMSDIFILPSKTEGLSNAMLEAMACKLSVVVTNVGGAPDVITHKENGFLISKDSPEAIYDAILGIASNPSQAKLMGEKAHATISERFDLNQTAQKLSDLYSEILHSL
jgi:glycosyltransferase involved in cell wall biosynthesis